MMATPPTINLLEAHNQRHTANLAHYTRVMAQPDAELTIEEVAHVAKLARLRLDAGQLERFRSQISSILHHVSSLKSVNTDGVEPMAHPLSLTNRLQADEPGPTLTLDEVLMNAPVREGPFIAVPKVLDEGGA